MRKYMGGSVTVEAAFIVPLILMVVSASITLLFYHHDKVVLEAAAHETVVVMSAKEEVTEEAIEDYFQSLCAERLFLFSRTEAEIDLEESQIRLQGTSKRQGMTIVVNASMKRTSPERWVRMRNKLLGE